jgi:hypothetical protein
MRWNQCASSTRFLPRVNQAINGLTSLPPVISSDIVKLITDLETKYPVETWVVKGTHIWPLIRNKLYGYLFTFQVDANKRHSSAGSRLAQHGPAVVKGLARFAHAWASDYRHNRSPAGQVDAVFLSDGVSYAEIDGEWYEKFCDPLIERFERRHKRCFLMSPLREYYVPRHTPSMWVQPYLDLAIAAAVAQTRLQKRRAPDLSGFRELSEELAALGLAIPLQRLLNVQEDVERVEAVAAFYSRQLRRLRPAVAFGVSYYSVEGMAFNLACHRLGITAVDIQHGAEGDLHAAYGQWRKVPVEGYALLPAVFWCWSEIEADAIRRWNAGLRNRHDVVVGGHPWLYLWQQGTAPFVEHYDRLVREFKAAGGHARHILVTLQHGLADVRVLEPLLDAMGGAPAQWQWWVRLHPAMLNEREAVRELLRARGSRHFELDAATDLPLYMLLKHADAHVTHSSYTVVEAAAYGVPSVVFSPYGAELLADQSARGVVAAYSGPEITAAVASSIDNRGQIPAEDLLERLPAPDMDHAIDEILNFASRAAADRGADYQSAVPGRNAVS